ncbi:MULTISPECIES: hypothetical protein [unclassified Rhizobium]|uniref:hypothetical protein n=1 Tax=unclassified Rhizobium TaxID=2613769 RepID=UPI000AA253AF|nr:MULTISPECIES: hypothetical protein [unclassified Rhizobium]
MADGKGLASGCCPHWDQKNNGDLILMVPWMPFGKNENAGWDAFRAGVFAMVSVSRG